MLVTIMKLIPYIVLFFALFSCEKIEDHYRIKDITIKVGNVSMGPNTQCVNIGNKTDSSYADLFGVQIEFIREYYSTENSSSSGIMYSPKGWKGCSETISKLNITSKSVNIDNLLFGPPLITGINEAELTSFRCQEKFGCECRSALNISNIDSLISSFNNQQKTNSSMFISEQYDETPFIFFIDKSELEKINGESIKVQIEMSNGDIINAESNNIKIKK